MKVKSKHIDTLKEIFSESIEPDIKSELRKELNGYKKKYFGAKDDIRNWEEMNNISIKSSKISTQQLNDCIIFIINEQLFREKFIEQEFH